MNRSECEKLKMNLQNMNDEEKRISMEKLQMLKDEELENQKLIWQNKTNELLEEVNFIF